MPNRRSGDPRLQHGRDARRRPHGSADRNQPVLGKLLSILRLVYAPVMLWAVMIAEDDTIALSAFGLAIITDLLDSWLNRKQLGRRRSGELLDVVANTVFVLAAILALWQIDVIPWPIALLVPLRFVGLLAMIPALRSRGVRTLPVHLLGKVAAFCLLASFPLLYLSHDIPETLDLGLEPSLPIQVAQAFGWAFALWGILLLWWSLVLYAQEARRLMATTPPREKGGASRA
ncbi:cardiolipin synthase [Nocardioides sp. YR527]|uniref:CDP-alcohol phosphatidyltransferase family protein n=1 Tax=Nocardioides sp. YR527 TaxID=1881028 RepID=UPI00088998B2|nr:CDP-alcohol phosphatidyltransferase family protein [Nocardioides sp. YR527]SDJ86154.1 cardiolipin synthase [Nocardioides sp. YR527]